MSSSLQSKVLMSFTAAILLIAAWSYFYLSSKNQFISSSGRVREFYGKIHYLGEIISLLKDLENNEHGYIISSKEEFVKFFYLSKADLNKKTQDFQKIISKKALNKKSFEKIHSLINTKIAHSEFCILLNKEGKVDQVERLSKQGRGKILMDEIRNEIIKIENKEKNKLSEDKNSLEFHSRKTLLIIISGLLLTLCLFFVGVIKILHELKKRHHLEEELYDKNKELHGKNDELATINEELKTANETILEYSESTIKNQELLFRHVVDNFPSPLLIFDKNEDLQFINAAGIKEFGKQNITLINKSFEEIFPIEKSNNLHLFFKEAINTKIPVQKEITEIINEKVATHILRFIPLISSNDDVNKTLLIAFDITDRKNFENKILQLNEELEKKVRERTLELEKLNQDLKEYSEEITDLYNNAPCGYYSMDKGGTILKINDTSLKLLDYKREEILNKNVLILLKDEDQETYKESFIQFIKNGRIENLEGEFIRKDGTAIPILINATAVYDPAGNFLMSRSTFTDNTELKKTKIEVDKYVEALKAVNKELESFSYSISHDLRAPLRSINGFSNILKNDYYHLLEDEGKRYLNIILQNTKQMGKLIDDLLEFAKLGRKGMSQTFFNMGEIVTDTFTHTLENVENKKDVMIDICPLPFVVADRNLIKQVWTNLIGNALKFSSKQFSPEITINYEDNQDSYTFYIKDNGVGFDTKYSNKLFGVFQRLHTPDEFEGTGVGLAIVQRIVTSHGGKAWADSELGKGATFYFTLPKL